jgi:rod shape determining protein RodA
MEYNNRIDDNIKSSVDWLTIALYMLLVIGGWLSIYGASYDYEHVTSIFDLASRSGKQLIWIGTSLVLGFILLKLESRIYDVFAYFIYAFVILLLIVTIIIAPEIKGSRSWLVITNDIRIQPAEFAKFAVALALAKYISRYNFKMLNIKNLLAIAGLILLPFVLIILQNETGSALVYVAFILVLYREGLPGVILGIILAAVVFFVIGLKYSETDIGIITLGEFVSVILIILISVISIKIYSKKRNSVPLHILGGGLLIFGIPYGLSLLGVPIDFGIVALVALAALIIYLIFLTFKHWSLLYTLVLIFAIASMSFVVSTNYLFNDVLQPHQQMRIKVTLGMEEDLMGAGYNVNQSKIAIGSGGLLGKGFLNGTQTKLKYVPEQDTDFIFCTVGEEQGFVGSVAVLVLFLALILRLVYLAERQREVFGRVYGYSVASIFLFHIAINVGMVIGLTPVIGIPLPFFSYGGSSLWGFTILLFIFLRIDMTRKRR